METMPKDWSALIEAVTMREKEAQRRDEEICTCGHPRLYHGLHHRRIEGDPPRAVPRYCDAIDAGKVGSTCECPGFTFGPEVDALKADLAAAIARAEKAEAKRDEALALLREASQDVQRGWASLGCACLAGPLYDQILALLARVDAAKGGE
jgi:hypothetical protein